MKIIENKLLKVAIRVTVGIVFVVSALLKVVSIDSFEIYIYSFGLLKLNTTFLFARLIISLELFLGILLVLGIYVRKVIISSLLMLFVFSVFILFLLFNNNTEHCHCFGDIVELSHIASIAKNLILILLLSFIYSISPTKIKFEKYILISLFILSISLLLIISPPDSFMHQFYAKQTSFNQQKLDEYIVDNKYETGKKVLCFYGATCRFCELASKKISVILEKTGKDKLIHYVFLGSNEEIENFFKETNTPTYSFSTLSGGAFLRITDGQMPLIVLLEDGKVKKKYGYRDIDENEIIDFLGNEE